MTRTLRRNHLIAWLVLTPAVVAILVLALHARPYASLGSEGAPPESAAQRAAGVAP